MSEIKIVCRICHQSFTFTEDDQARFDSFGFKHPKTCRDCKNKEKQEEVIKDGLIDEERECRECKQMFTLTASEKRFFLSKKLPNGLPYEFPRRCGACRAQRRAMRN